MNPQTIHFVFLGVFALCLIALWWKESKSPTKDWKTFGMYLLSVLPIIGFSYLTWDHIEVISLLTTYVIVTVIHLMISYSWITKGPGNVLEAMVWITWPIVQILLFSLIYLFAAGGAGIFDIYSQCHLDIACWKSLF